MAHTDAPPAAACIVVTRGVRRRGRWRRGCCGGAGEAVVAVPRMKRTSTPGSPGSGVSLPSAPLRRMVKRAAHLPDGMSAGWRGLQSGAATRPSTCREVGHTTGAHGELDVAHTFVNIRYTRYLCYTRSICCTRYVRDIHVYARLNC